mgnify:CR=1 FL=1
MYPQTKRSGGESGRGRVKNTKYAYGGIRTQRVRMVHTGHVTSNSQREQVVFMHMSIKKIQLFVSGMKQIPEEC